MTGTPKTPCESDISVPIDDMFSPGGVAVALLNGCNLYEYVRDRGVYLTKADLTCSKCDDPISPPKRRPARWLALNKIEGGGETRCLECLRSHETTIPG